MIFHYPRERDKFFKPTFYYSCLLCLLFRDARGAKFKYKLKEATARDRGRL